MRYPKTPHLTWSPGVTEEDIVAEERDIEFLNGEEVIVTEKMQGENVRMSASTVTGRHVSRQGTPIWRRWVKGFWEAMRGNFSSDTLVYGENMWSAQSIHYKDLKSFFLAFLVVDGNDRDALSWDETQVFAEDAGMELVPVIYRGPFNRKKIEEAYKTYCNGLDRDSEGYVVRLAGAFSMDDFEISVFKWVRPGHKKDTRWEQGPYFQNIMKDAA